MSTQKTGNSQKMTNLLDLILGNPIGLDLEKFLSLNNYYSSWQEHRPWFERSLNTQDTNADLSVLLDSDTLGTLDNYELDHSIDQSALSTVPISDKNLGNYASLNVLELSNKATEFMTSNYTNYPGWLNSIVRAATVQNFSQTDLNQTTPDKEVQLDTSPIFDETGQTTPTAFNLNNFDSHSNYSETIGSADTNKDEPFNSNHQRNDLGEKTLVSISNSSLTESLDSTPESATLTPELASDELPVDSDTEATTNSENINLSAQSTNTTEIRGIKWNDKNGNGIKDASEPGLANWRIFLDQNFNGQFDRGEISTRTDQNGNYTFTNLTPGTYTVADVLKPGWTTTFPNTDSGTQSVLIPVTDRRDLIFDPQRDLLYITTSDGDVERYDVATQTLLTPFDVGNSLNGGDITPDNSALYIAEGQRGATQGFVRKLNLSDGTVANLTYDLDFGEGGAWDVKISSNGKGFLTTDYEGSGWTPFRELDLSTDTLSIRTDAAGSSRGEVRQNTSMSRSADRNLLFMTESDTSRGPIFTYDAVTDTFPKQSGTGGFLSSALSAVNRDGSLIALELGNNISIFDQNLNSTENLSNVNGGIAFDPLRDILYAANSTTDEIIAFDTNTWDELYRLEIGEDIEGRFSSSSRPLGNGEMTISDDGQHLFMSTPDGVRMLTLGIPGTYSVNLSAGETVENINFAANAIPVLRNNKGLTLDEGNTAIITTNLLRVTDADNSLDELTYTLSNASTNGILKLNGTPLSVGQTFSQRNINRRGVSYQHNGSETSSDSFSFTVTDGAGNTLSNNDFNITVNPVNDAPLLTVNQERFLRQSQTVTLSQASLQTTDPDNLPSELIYSLSSLPNNGILTLNDITLSATDSFTQEDINQGRIKYQHDGSNVTGDSFNFTVTDGTASLNSNFSFNITASTGVPSIVRDISPGFLSSSPTNLTNVNGILYFKTNEGFNRSALWKSDGTAIGTELVSSLSPANLTNVDGTLYFTASGELWKSDGTPAGTTQIKDIRAGFSSSSPANLTQVNGLLYFTANDGINGTELWKSDGTADGTVLVKDISAGSSSAFPVHLTNVNDTLYFTANDGINGTELWKSDGTANGTVLLKDINPGTDSSFIDNLTNVNDSLYFTAYDPNYGIELWKSDGTANGTVLVKDIYQGAGSSSPQNLTHVDGTLYFTAFDGFTGYQLWKSDSTTDETMLVTTINPGSGISSPQNLTAVNDTLYFTVNDEANHTELWKSDGTIQGTMLLKEFETTENSTVANLTNVDGTLYFTADDEFSGTELWKSDGTVAGTNLVRDIYLGGDSSSPENLTNLDGTLYFTANDGVNGTELWVV